MRKILPVLVFGLGVIFGGCSLVAQQADMETESPFTSRTGMVSQSGGKFFITSGSDITEITSRKVQLGDYVGKSVTVEGEFSGTTLYVDAVK